MKLWLRIALSIALVVVLFAYVVDGREVVHILHRFDDEVPGARDRGRHARSRAR